jgi:hypothetical protein
MGTCLKISERAFALRRGQSSCGGHTTFDSESGSNAYEPDSGNLFRVLEQVLESMSERSLQSVSPPLVQLILTGGSAPKSYVNATLQ